MYVSSCWVNDRYSILQHDKIPQIPLFLSQSWNVILLGQIKELFLKSLKENPEILKKLETEEPDEKTRALLKLILEEVQNDPEYSGLRH